MASPLGLTAAVMGGINASRQRTLDDNAAEDRQHMLKRRGIEDQALDAQTAANQAASAVIAQAAEAHKASGATTPYRPGALDAVRALDARSAAFVQAKDFRGFMENEGTAASARLRARQQFLQEFQSTGDFGSFVKNAYATLPSGDEVENVEIVKGGGADAPKGAPSGPDMARITLKSGRTVMADPKNVVAQITQSLRDPVKAAEQEAEMHFKALLKRQEVAAETEGKIKVEKVKGEEERSTEGVKQTNRIGLADVEHKGRKEVAGIQAGATLGAAKLGADSRVTAAETRAETAEKGNKPLRSDALQRLVINSGIGVIDPVTKQARGNEQSNAVALRAEQWLKQYPDMTELEAVNKAVGEFRARNPGKK